MSLCPSNDLHSVYLDGELPEQFKTEYEKHINSCPQCQQELSKLRALRNAFIQDCKEITPDEHFLDESFSRLQIKMGYSKTTSHHKPEMRPGSFKYFAMAAAAVVAVAFIVPLRLNSGKQNLAAASQSAMASIPAYTATANNVSLNSGRSVVISGNIDGTVFPSDYNRGYGHDHHNHDHGYRNGYGTSNVQYQKDMIRDVEMFRPDFNDEKTISIKISIPGMGDGPIPSDFPLPEFVITGSFE